MQNSRRAATAGHSVENRRCPRRKAQQPHQKRLSKSPPHPQQEERKKTKLCRHRKKPHTQKQGPSEMGAPAKTQKASYSRRERSGE